MRILLDESIPVLLRAHLKTHEVVSINDETLGWKGIRSGVLLDRMEGCFDLLITADRNIYAQQNLTGRSIAILVIPTNRRTIVIELADQIGEAAGRMVTGDYVVLQMPAGM